MSPIERKPTSPRSTSSARNWTTRPRRTAITVTLLALVIKASVSALRKHWEFDSSIHPDGDKLIRKSYYNIGFAADTPNGWWIQVVKEANHRGDCRNLRRNWAISSAKARAGELKSQDMQGATFTISSLGGIGGTAFTSIVNAPRWRSWA